MRTYKCDRCGKAMPDPIEPSGYRHTVATLAEAEYLRRLAASSTLGAVEIHTYELMNIARLLERGGADD